MTLQGFVNESHELQKQAKDHAIKVEILERQLQEAREEASAAKRHIRGGADGPTFAQSLWRAWYARVPGKQRRGWW